MRYLRFRASVLLLWGCAVLLLVGCGTSGGPETASAPLCPIPTIDAEPQSIPPGADTSTVFVAFVDPDPESGRSVVTALDAESGTFADPSAEVTTYTCAHDVIGPVTLCVDATWAPTEEESDECLETDCITVVCPEVKNLCPDIVSFEATPMVIPPGETTWLIQVVAEDPDDSPEPLRTTLSADSGSFDDPQAAEAVYTCDAEIGGEVRICVVASDGDETCDQERCITVECPGPPPDNICPVVEAIDATPPIIPPGETTALIEVTARDPDAQPEDVITTLSATSGSFEDPNAASTLYTCEERGPVEVCVVASDGDPSCPPEDRTLCTQVECPSTINRCAELVDVEVSPLQVAVGFDIDVSAEASDDDEDPVQYRWTSLQLRGELAEPSAATTTYRCLEAGDDVIKIEASDDGFELCSDSRQVEVTCGSAPP